MLVGRRAECDELDRLLTDALAGRSRVAVLRGDAGAGKSALLSYLSDRVGGWYVVKAFGVESEIELAYSGVHQICLPMLDQLERLPIPQRDALATVFGLSVGPAPDPFLVGLAALTLFAEVAEQRPLVCIVDDAHWLDRASAQLLGFVARRLLAERVVLVCASRTGIEDDLLIGLPEMPVRGLRESDARALLLGNLPGPLDSAVCDRIIAESHGNPLALLELPRTWRAEVLAGGFGLPNSRAVASKIERSYVERLDVLPAETRLLVLAAAAEPLGDRMLLQRAAETFGLDLAAADPAVEAGLITVARRVEFAHPLVRSAAYRSAAAGDRRRVHRALGDVTDAHTDPDRRVWHYAQATSGRDEEVAAELERSAERAQARGGLAASAAFLQRAVALTSDPARRAGRALIAAQANLQTGAFDAAVELVATANTGVLNEFQRGQVDLLRGQVAFASATGGDHVAYLLKAARRLEPFDLALARETYLTAWRAACMAGHLAVLVEICLAVEALPPPPDPPRPLDLLLAGLARLTTDGRAAATPILQRAAKAFAGIPEEDIRRWGWVAAGACGLTWDFEGAYAFSARQVQLARDAGAIALLPMHLAQLAIISTWKGDFAGVASLLAEADSVATAIGSPLADGTALRLRALQGREAETSRAIATAIELAAAEGQGNAAAWAHWAAAVLYNGLARYEEAASAAREASANPFDPWNSMWCLPELVEAATRGGNAELARDALDRLAETTHLSGTDAALGIEARCRALVADGTAADSLYREAIDRLSRAQLRPDLARAHLVYGEWLRRERQRANARTQLRIAHDMLGAMGMEGFADRARRELLATGEHVRNRRAETRDELTPQEEQIARLARDGLSNPKIGAMLFLSPRTVEWHLRNVFAKVGINSRSDLQTALPSTGREPTLA